jgi:hypothetical protein
MRYEKFVVMYGQNRGQGMSEAEAFDNAKLNLSVAGCAATASQPEVDASCKTPAARDVVKPPFSFPVDGTGSVSATGASDFIQEGAPC